MQGNSFSRRDYSQIFPERLNLTLSWVMTSADTESSVTKATSCFVVAPSRNECARTKAPGRARDGQSLSCANDPPREQGDCLVLTWEVRVAQQELRCCVVVSCCLPRSASSKLRRAQCAGGQESDVEQSIKKREQTVA